MRLGWERGTHAPSEPLCLGPRFAPQTVGDQGRRELRPGVLTARREGWGGQALGFLVGAPDYSTGREQEVHWGALGDPPGP